MPPFFPLLNPPLKGLYKYKYQRRAHTYKKVGLAKKDEIPIFSFFPTITLCWS